MSFSRDDIARWGGEIRKTGSVPWVHTETFKSLIRGDVDAIFDEAAYVWVPQALDAGITVLPLAEGTVTKLEAMGYLERRAARQGERRRIYLTPRTWGMVKIVHATLLQIQGEWAADIGPDRFGDFMTTLRRFAARGCEAGLTAE